MYERGKMQQGTKILTVRFALGRIRGMLSAGVGPACRR